MINNHGAIELWQFCIHKSAETVQVTPSESKSPDLNYFLVNSDDKATVQFVQACQHKDSAIVVFFFSPRETYFIDPTTIPITKLGILGSIFL